MQEFAKGRTFDGPYGHYVHLDLRHLGEEVIDKKLPFVRELASKYVGIDPVHEPIPVRPVVHYMMGGISTDIDAKTALEGLYAAGETACVSLLANRLVLTLSRAIGLWQSAGRSAATLCLRRFGARLGKNREALAADEQSVSIASS
jgi:fumarate reductase flavoprotein subunit